MNFASALTDAHERFIAPGEYGFRRRDEAERLRDVVKFRWEMVSTADTSVGPIRSDYQFIERWAGRPRRCVPRGAAPRARLRWPPRGSRRRCR